MALPKDLQEQLNTLQGPREPQKPLLDRIREEVAAETAPAAEDTRVEEEAPKADLPAEPSDEPVDVGSLRERMAAETARREAMEKELAFLRARASTPQAPPEPPVDPLANILAQIRVTPEEWTAMLADPDIGARQATEALQRMLVIGNQTARAQMSADMQQVLDQRDAALRERQEADDARSTFWSKYTELEPYTEIVQAEALRVAQEQPGAQRTTEQVMQEVSRRAKATLKSKYGVDLAPTRATGSVAQRRILPARADAGSQDGRTAPKLQQWEKDLYRLAGRKIA